MSQKPSDNQESLYRTKDVKKNIEKTQCELIVLNYLLASSKPVSLRIRSGRNHQNPCGTYMLNNVRK